jgi:hypothetical protein
VPARGVDLTKLERTLTKEPAYKNKPKYCLLVFGLEAKARAWLVIDGNMLYVDRNCDGDLTGAGKQVDIRRVVNGDPKQVGVQVAAGDITEPDGKIKHTGLVIGKYINMNVSIKVAGGLDWMAGCHSNNLIFAERPQDAPVIHFGGPLTLGLTDHPQSQPRLLPGKDGHLEVYIGTPGLGKSTFAIVAARQMPKGATALAEIEFPNPKPGEEPQLVKVPLKPDE